MYNYIADRLWYSIYLTPLVSLLLLFYFWNATNPGTVGPLGILFVFVLLYLFWASTFFIVLHLGFSLFRKTSLFRVFMTKRENKPFNWKVSYYIASIIAFMPVLLLAMQSVNQLTIRDVLLVVLFTGLAIFYVSRRT